jgi:hypothetical protein
MARQADIAGSLRVVSCVKLDEGDPLRPAQAPRLRSP